VNDIIHFKEADLRNVFGLIFFHIGWYFVNLAPIKSLVVYIAHILSGEYFWTTCYLTQRSISSINNPQNSEMKFCENIKLKRWKSSKLS
jgi:hypothetical protein